MRALASVRPFPAAASRRRAGEGPKPGANPSWPARRGCRRFFAARDGHDAEGTSTRETEYVAKTATQATDAKENLTESQQVQRDLALRMMEAQSRWLEAPGTPRRLRKKSKRRPPVDADPAADATPTAASSEDVAGDEDLIGMDAETVVGEAWERGRWLLGLLVLQSSSSVVLQHYGDLVRDNLIITLFLTMLVGAGGNAGNQSAIRVIRGLATGEMVTTRECFVGTLWRQAGRLPPGVVSLRRGFVASWSPRPPGDWTPRPGAAVAGVNDRRGGGRLRHRPVAVLHSDAEHGGRDGDAVCARGERTGPGQRGDDDPGRDGHHGGGHHVRGVLAGVHAGPRDVGGGGG